MTEKTKYIRSPGPFVWRGWLGQIVTSLVLSAVAATALATPRSEAGRRALLVGVSQYNLSQPNQPCVPYCGNNLGSGPLNDVAAMRKVLEQYWGFRPSSIVTLTNRQATRRSILDELRKLVGWAAPGKFAVIYFSGHGISPQAPRTGDAYPPPPMAVDTGALVVAPNNLSRPLPPSLLVGQTDIVPLLKDMDKKGAEVFAAFDACFSQNTARSASNGIDRRFRGWSWRGPLGLGHLPNVLKSSGLRSPYRDVFYLSASGASEPAVQGKANTFDGEVHGFFTDAMVRVLSGRAPHDELRPGVMTYDEFADAVEAYMRIHRQTQTPVQMPARFEAQRGIGQRPFLDWRAPAVGVEIPRDSRLSVYVEPIATSVRQALQKVANLTLVSQPSQAEYIVRTVGSSDASAYVVTDQEGEPIYGSDAPGGAIPLESATVAQSLRLRAALRRLWSLARSRPGGLSFHVSLEDNAIGPTFGQTVHPTDTLHLLGMANRDANLLVLDLMGDGESKVWLAPGVSNRDCRSGARLAAGVRRELCTFYGSSKPYGLDQLYVIAIAGPLPSAFIRPREHFGVRAIDSLISAAERAPKQFALREFDLFTVPGT